MLECVVNISEGRDAGVLAALADAAGRQVLDVHRDGEHHRSVFTLAGPDVEAAVQRLAARAVGLLSLAGHQGVHPRIGVVDVVPFVALAGSTLADAVAARDRFAAWAGTTLGVPCFLYGPERTLPDVRRQAFAAAAGGIVPDTGPPRPHPAAGAMCVGARPPLVAYNLWLAPPATLAQGRAIAAGLRGPDVRALGLAVGASVQVSCNLIRPEFTGPLDVYEAVAAAAPVARAELVGLVPEAVLRAIPEPRWAMLDMSADRTIEARLEEAGLNGGSRTAGG